MRARRKRGGPKKRKTAAERRSSAAASNLSHHPTNYIRTKPEQTKSSLTGRNIGISVLDAAYRSGIVPKPERTSASFGAGWDTITVLRARGGRRLTKLIGRDGTITSFDDAKYYDMVEIPIDGLDHLEDDLRRLLHQPNRGVVRGRIADPGRVTGVRRKLLPDERDYPPTLVEVPRLWLALDIDGLARPANIAADDLVACAGIAIAALPREFHSARCLAAATSSHGYKPGLRLRLWFWLDRLVGTAELKRWIPRQVVDHGVFGAAQIIATASPVFAGACDPLPVRLVRLPHGTACVTVPDLAEPKRTTPPPLRRAVIPDDLQIRRILARVSAAKQGERNSLTFWAACRLAEMAATGLLSESDALDYVVEAATASGLPYREALATARSGIGSGN